MEYQAMVTGVGGLFTKMTLTYTLLSVYIFENTIICYHKQFENVAANEIVNG